jgi:hypothetical protein
MREDKTNRLVRFQNGPPEEIIETLLNSINNFYIREIDQAATSQLWLLVVLGIHSVALTISEGIFDKKGLTGFTFFLEHFMDKDDDGFKFSVISHQIHNYRNVVAHQWLSASGYDFGIDESMTKGWEEREKVIYFNPKIYYEVFKNNAFGRGGKIWNYDDLLSSAELESAKVRLLKKYETR